MLIVLDTLYSFPGYRITELSGSAAQNRFNLLFQTKKF